MSNNKVPLNYDIPIVSAMYQKKLYEMIAKLKFEPTFYDQELMAFPYHKIDLNYTIKDFLQSRLLDVPLQAYQLKDICIITPATGVPDELIKSNFKNIKYPYIRETDLGAFSPNVVTEYVDKDLVIPDAFVDDLIIVTSATYHDDITSVNSPGYIGNVNIVYDEYSLSPNTAVIQIKKSPDCNRLLIPEYLLLSLKVRLPEEIFSVVDAIKRNNCRYLQIDLDKLLAIKVALPAKEYQLKIACEWKEYLYLLGKYHDLI
jgi:restriction endonuclease S subunit